MTWTKRDKIAREEAWENTKQPVPERLRMPELVGDAYRPRSNNKPPYDCCNCDLLPDCWDNCNAGGMALCEDYGVAVYGGKEVIW